MKINRIFSVLALKLAFFLSIQYGGVASRDYKVVCYFTNWAVQRPGMGSMIPEHMDPCLCTHIIYAFSEMDDNKLTPMEKYDHVDGEKSGFFERINRLKHLNPKLRTLLAVGGWEMGMADFTAMVKDDKNIKKFVQTTIDYLRKWDFDGLDLDFEYPGIDWRGSPPEDQKAFTKLCKMLREGFEKESKETGKERLLLTAAVAGARNTIDKAYEVDKLSEYLDWFNLMTYDLHGPWDTNAGHHSAIHGKDKQDYLYIDFIVKHYESKGAPRNKLVLGLANYGRSDAPAMPYTGFKGESGFLSYYETCLMLSCESWKEFWNEAQLVPYAKGKENYPWAGYDNVKSMQIKAKYIMDENLLGAMFWAIDLDDFTGKFCCQGHYPLIRTVKSILENDPSIMPPTNICDKCPTQEYKTLKKKNRKRRSLDEVCTEKGEGIWKDPEDCTKYYICRHLTTTWAEKKHEACYVGSYFDPAANSCKWVGGSLNCASLVGEGEEEDKPTKTKKDDKKPVDEESESDNTQSSGTEGTRNRQKIFYDGTSDKQTSPFGENGDTIMPRNLYTCKADLKLEFDSLADYVKCYSCESDAKNIDKCKNAPDDGTSVIWCYQRTQSCYSKSIQNTTTNELISFSRGCASLSDLDAALSNTNDGEQHTTAANRVNNPRSNTTNTVTNCIVRPNKSKTCYAICDTNLCNNVTDIKSSATATSHFNFKFFFIFNFILFVSFSLLLF